MLTEPFFDDLGSSCNHRPLCSWLTFTGDRPRTNRCTEAGLQVALLTISFLGAARLSLSRQSRQPAAVQASLWCARFWCHRPRLRRIAQQWKTALLVQGICILLISWLQCNSWYRYNADSSPFMAGPLHARTSYNADWPYRRLAGLWSLFNILLFYAGPVSQHFLYKFGTASHTITLAQRFPTTWRSTSTFSRVGPKSGHIPGRHVCHLIFVLILFTLIPTIESGAVDARVVDLPTGSTEATLVAKPAGTRQASVPTFKTPSRSTKRSYRRAYTRACQQGGAFYKGQWRPQAWFRGVQLRPQYLPPLRSPPQAHVPHWRTMSWNCGGLTADVYRELETYAKDFHLDVLMIQESKWTLEALRVPGQRQTSTSSTHQALVLMTRSEVC